MYYFVLWINYIWGQKNHTNSSPDQKKKIPHIYKMSVSVILNHYFCYRKQSKLRHMVMVIYIFLKKNFISAYSLEHLSSLTPVQRRPSLHSNFVWVTGKCSLPLLLQSKVCLLGLLETSSNASRVEFLSFIIQYRCTSV